MYAGSPIDTNLGGAGMVGSEIPRIVKGVAGEEKFFRKARIVRALGVAASRIALLCACAVSTYSL